MKFGHLADCHIGSWRNPILRELNLESFKKAINICIEQNTAFVLISGDLFDTSLPNIETLKQTTEILSKLKEKDIDTYIIPGSHDFSPSGKTMIDVLEKANLVKNVMNFKDNILTFTEDKTNTKITGIYGKKGSLEIELYKNLEIEQTDGFKIFMFHTTLNELRPKELEKVEGMPTSLLPKNFNYYAGGHVHIRETKDNISYPGPIFPNNFAELEKLKHGSFNIIEIKNNKPIINNIKLNLQEIKSKEIDVTNLTVEQAENKIKEQLKEDYTNKILTLRIKGTLEQGKPSDLNINIKAKVFLKNTASLTSKEFKEFEVEVGETKDIEDKIIENYATKIKKEKSYIKHLIEIFSIEKQEGERNLDFEKRIIENATKKN